MVPPAADLPPSAGRPPAATPGPPGPGGPARPAGRGLKIALALSLALNLAVAGILGGTLLRGVDRPMRAEVRDLGFGPFGEALSPADRAALRAAFLDAGPDLRGMRRDMRSDVARLLAALRAEPFDAAALRAALEAQDARARERLALGRRLLADRLVAMSEAERLAFADRLQSVLARGRGGGGAPPEGGREAGREAGRDAGRGGGAHD